MNIQTIVTRVRGHLDRQRRYSQAVAEINSLTSRDLADMRGNRDEMLRDVRREILG
jgi:uncharacterized protein YjiS (DUF1127 family)